MQALLVACISFVYNLSKLFESSDHYGEQLKSWIFRGGTPHPPKDLLFSYPECIAVVWRWVVVAGTDGWVGNQHTDNCCCPILLNPLICIVLPSYPLTTPHTSCTVLPSSTQTTPSPDSIALNMHSGRPKLAHHPTNIPLQRQHLNTLHWPPCTGQLYYLSSYSCPFLMDH